jgi:predicted DNA-binding protein with PD1-like motif
MTRKPYTSGRIFIGRLPKGSDLLGSIARIANEESIKVATVSVHGSVSRVSLTIFDQGTKQQEPIEREEGLEIVSLTGTVSQFKGRSMPKLNGIFAAPGGGLVGGALALGTEVYACEVVIAELEGGALIRDFDPETGLPLWKENSMLIGE